MRITELDQSLGRGWQRRGISEIDGRGVDAHVGGARDGHIAKIAGHESGKGAVNVGGGKATRAVDSKAEGEWLVISDQWVGWDG